MNVSQALSRLGKNWFYSCMFSEGKMEQLLGSWTLVWFVVLNVVTLALGVCYWLFERSKAGK